MEREITEVIEDFVRLSRENRLPEREEPYFVEPLVGFAAAHDPLFSEYKEIIGTFHNTPQEVFEAAHGASARAATVICWVLPISPEIRRGNARESTFPSADWAYTRQYGEGFNVSLRRHLVAWLTRAGHRGVAPLLEPSWRQFADSPVGFASTWSERHAAYAAGLGTFSLNDGLITAKGIAHRVGTVITDLPLRATPRTAADHRSHCLWYREGTCGACMRRCPAGAIGEAGHDKALCYDYLYRVVTDAIGSGLGITQTGCGLCQTAVPCESRIPRGKNGTTTAEAVPRG